ncbi:hypothetical protein QYR09_01975 [Cellulophaga lytica]|nr:hypothetical protein QYR09_01975 [Cellulophaga lytica]
MTLLQKSYGYILSGGQILFIILFVYAASSKWIEFSEFEIQLGQSPTLSAYAEWLVWVLPGIECVVALLFIIPRYVLVAFYLSYALLVMFTTYIVVTLYFSDYIPCSCGGVLEVLGWKEHILFNVAFILLAVSGIYSYEYIHENNVLCQEKRL